MIDVWGVIANAFWILGLAVILAVSSYASYVASRTHRKTRRVLATLKYALAMNVGLLFFLIGMATTEDRWWARLIWITIALAVIAESVWRWIQHRRSAADGE